MGIKQFFTDGVSRFLNKDKAGASHGIPMTDFERLCEELRQADVVLVEGRSRVSEVIKTITNSPWTHAALYIGRLDEIKDGSLQNSIAEHYSGDPNEQLIVEAMLGDGTIVTPMSQYEGFHLRICRPRGLSKPDRSLVIKYAVGQLGFEYDIRHLFDLARFMLPYSFMPKRWRSTLFEHNAGEPTRNVCSFMIAQAFRAVSYPILPVATKMEDGSMKLFPRNSRLFTPKDFDYSPYFDIIKYPYFNFDEVAAYRALPWDADGVIYNKEGDAQPPVAVVNESEAPIQSGSKY